MTHDVLTMLPPNTELLASAWRQKTDDELMREINSFTPVTSTRNVWAFWKTGWSTMRPWCQRNVLGWMRRQGPDWTVRVLDCVEGSPNNVHQFLQGHHLPRAFLDDTMEGAYVGAHMADLVRLPCLYEYGGVWLDVSIMLFRSLEDICWQQLTENGSKYEIGGFVLPNNHEGHQIECGYMENWFIAVAAPHNAFIHRWYTVFLKYWEDCVESRNAKEHPLFVHLDTDGFRQDMIDYLAQHLSFYRVRTLVDLDDQWDGPAYYRQKMFLLDARHEAYFLPSLTQWKGQKCYDILSHRMSDTDQQVVCDLVHVTDTLQNNTPREITLYMAANCCLTKSVHGFKGDTQLSDLWNKPENHNADISPGSCAEYLSQASRHLRQLRTLQPLVVDEEESLSEPSLKAHLLEPARSTSGITEVVV